MFSTKKSSLRLFSLFAPLKRIGTGLLLGAGSAVAALFIAFALLIDAQTLAVFLAALGTGLGVLIISLAAPKWFIAADKERQKQLEQQLEAALKAQSVSAAELERIKSQKLQISHIQTALKVTLLEIDTVLTDFKRQSLGSRDKTLGGVENMEYIGVLRKKTKVMLGIDLRKLHIEQIDNSLRISGLQAQYQGVRQNDDEWLFNQVQIQEDNILLSNKVRVSVDHQLLLPARDEHQKELQTRLESGAEFQVYDLALRKMAEQWLRVLLVPLGYPLTFSETANPQAALLVDYLDAKLLSLDASTHRIELPNNPVNDIT